MPKYSINIDKKVLRLLGAQLYGDTPSIIAELVQNSYDADANNVWITISTKGYESIIVEDDGIGMSSAEINDRFLNIGYNRRDTFPTSALGRKVLGRKGIGKLAVFSLAKVVNVYSLKDGEKAGCRLDFDKITLQDQDPEELDINDITFNPDHLSTNGAGTKIVLTNMQKSIARSFNYVINRLVRTFDVNTNDFKLYIRKNNEEFYELCRADLNYSNYMDTIVTIGDDFDYLVNEVNNNSIEDKYKHIIKYKDLIVNKGQIAYQQMPFQIKVLDKSGNEVPVMFFITGWIGTVKDRGSFKTIIELGKNSSEPEKTKFEVSVSDNRISVFSRNKMGEFDLLSKTQTNRIADAYLIGEIYAEIFEDDSLADMSISNRRGYDETDQRYVQMIDIVSKIVRYITLRKQEINSRRKEDKKKELREQETIEIKKNLYSKAPRTKKILEEKLDQLELEEFEEDLLQFGRVLNASNATKKIFISHQSDCKEYGHFLVKIIELLGINPVETVIFTAIPELGVPHGRDIYDYLRECFRDDLYVIFLFSKSFYNSNVCIAETGAAWATNKHYSNVVIDMNFSDIDNPCDRNRRGVDLSNLTNANNIIDLRNLFIAILNEIGMSDIANNVSFIEAKIKEAISKFAVGLNGLVYFPRRRFLAVPICSVCHNQMSLNHNGNGMVYKCTNRSRSNFYEAEII